MKPDINDPTSLTPGINWDRARLKRFKKAFARSVWRTSMEKAAQGTTTFEFEGKEYLLSFAGYLIEKLDERLNGTKKS